VLESSVTSRICQKLDPQRVRLYIAPPLLIIAPEGSITLMKYTPMRYTPVRCMPVRCVPVRCMPVRCVPVRYTPVRCMPVRCIRV
jgi:hypothetical protein